MINEKNSIYEFIDYAYKDINLIVENIHQIVPEREDIHSLVKESLKEIISTFDIIKKQLAETRLADFKKVGLSGNQLKLKLQEYEWRRSIFNKELENFKVLSDYEKGEKWEVIRKIISSLIKSIDNILGSLSIIIPQAHIIKEIKDTIDSIISG